jgi:preprotein translocase subunit SecA
MRIFGGDRLKNMMGKMGWEEGENLTSRFMTKAVERAQVRVEQRNFDIRKNLLKYDDVMNDQRKQIFEQRLEFMTDDDVSDVIEDFRYQVCEDMIETHIPKKAYAEQWDIEGLTQAAKDNLAMDIPFDAWAKEEGIADEEMLERLKKATDDAFGHLTNGIDTSEIQRVEKQILLQVIDSNWREHLQQLDALKGVVGLRAHGQRDPLNEYKSESFTLFDTLLTDLRQDVTKTMTRLLINAQMQRQQQAAPAQQSQMRNTAPMTPTPAPARGPMDMIASGAIADTSKTTSDNGDQPLDPELTKSISRNSPCPCGSGKKFKHCHGRTA